MRPDPAPGRDPAALAALVLPALATAVAVAFAATGAGLLLPGAELGDAAALGVRLGGATLAVAGVLALVTRWGRAARVAARDLGAVLLAAVVVMAGVTALTYAFSQATLTLPEPDPVPSTTSTTERTTTTERDTTATTTPRVDRPDDGLDLFALLAALLPVLLFAVVVGLLVYALARVLGITSVARWARGAPPPVVGQAVPLASAAAEAGLEASLDAVNAEVSPRDAISDAYARLLAALADAGAGRRRQEAPHEHLDRVLRPLGVRSAPLHRLAELFVLARFSQHPVTGAHRDEAATALREALADLRQAEARRAPASPIGGAR